MKLLVNGSEKDVFVSEWSEQGVKLAVDGVTYSFTTQELSKMVSGISTDKKKGHVLVHGQDLFIEPLSKKNCGGALEAGAMISPMPGKIFKVIKVAGQEVKKGETILIMEAMKMEHPVKASRDGKILEIIFNEGQQVDGGVELVSLKPAGKE